MFHKLTFKQAGGRRAYDIADIEVPAGDSKPLLPEEVVKEMDIESLMQAVVHHISRVTGYGYLNSFIEEGSRGAEIGVDMGDGAQRLLENKPAMMHLVDPWVEWKDGWSGTKEQMDNRYGMVTGMFGVMENVDIVRMSGAEWMSGQETDCLDWVYIDGDHHKDAAREDMEQALRVVKPGGIIAVDDLHCPVWHKEIGPALYEFRKAHKGEVKVLWDRSDPAILRVL